ncbi:MAG: phosphodiesterase, partial [Firmicutes bacterium]|nr:phosphodiesterase [Bacillota bacterium]
DSIKIVLQHHERCDGSGYPQQLLHDQINENARLVMLVDVYDALTTDRPYRAALRPHQVLTLLKYSGEQAYDPIFLRTCLDHIPAYPVGTALRLSNGDIGLVIKNKVGKTFSPTVRVYLAEEREPYKDEFEIDLAEKNSVFVEEVLSEEEREKLFPLCK